MKKLLLLFLIAMLLISASGMIKLARLTLVNKSGYMIHVKMTGVEVGQFYYLTIPVGTKEYPETSIFTIIPDTYRWQITYSKEGEDGLFVPIGEEYRELTIEGKMRINLLAPTTFYNFCDPDAYSIDQLLANPNCRVEYLRGEQNNFKLIPLGVWYFRY
jgi:hypothetical protein